MDSGTSPERAYSLQGVLRWSGWRKWPRRAGARTFPRSSRATRSGSWYGSGRREGAAAGVRGPGHRQARRRHQRELHRPEGFGRRRRRAHLPAAQPDDRLGRRGAPGPRAPRQALLSPRAERQGCAHQGAAARAERCRHRPTLTREREAWAEAHLLVGVDEAGRGPLAGPVVAAAVVFPASCRARPRCARQQDPARRSPRPPRRPAFVRRALGVGVGAASVREIDRLNIRVATALAMRRASAACSRAAHASCLERATATDPHRRPPASRSRLCA